ncbi:hypothetical protein P3342_011995 [Pyrenophora teres f. teres]|nr:hypothetical protein P3342_011995 [Pyrenophora teres f. teres]
MSTVQQQQRITANCEIIWGKREYDFDVETDEDYYYQILVREDCGTYWGETFTYTPMYVGLKSAWRESDIMLQGSAENVLRERQKSREAAAAANA